MFIVDFAGVDLEGPIPDKVSKHMDQYEDGTGDQRDRNVGLVAGDQDRELGMIHYKSHVTRKPVFGVCDQLWLKPACSATETS